MPEQYWLATCRIVSTEADALDMHCFASGCLGSWQLQSADVLEVIYYFPQSVDAEGCLNAFSGSGLLGWSIEKLPAQDWVRINREQYSPLSIGQKLTIIAPWHDKSAYPKPIIINPAQAFGTGLHPTTRLIIEYLDAMPNLSGACLDVGGGSGILAFCALALGCSQAVIIDIDFQAALECLHNKQLNSTPDSNLNAVQGDVRCINGSFDLILANIRSMPLIEMRHDFKRLLTNNGLLIVSGILDNEWSNLCSELESAQFSLKSRQVNQNWVAGAFKLLS